MSFSLDLAVTLALVAAAVGWLVWNLTARERKPACHVVAGPSKDAPEGGGGGVVVGASLARGLAAVQTRRHQS